MHWPNRRSRNSATAPILPRASRAIERRCDRMLTRPSSYARAFSCARAFEQLLEVIRCRIMKRYRAVGAAAHELAYDVLVLGIELRRAAFGHHLPLRQQITVVRDGADFPHVVRYQDAGDAEQTVERLNQAHDHTHRD